MEKQLLVVNATVNSFEEAKELLGDLEVLNEKYEVRASVTIISLVNPE
ncbi:hypothetical protein [Enterococcus rotai]